MNNLTRLIVASGAGLILGLTASPALAAPSTGAGTNGAQVERFESSDGTIQNHTVARQHAGDQYTTNGRYQEVLGGTTTDWKTQYTVLNRVTKLSSQITTSTEAGVTCRANSLTVIANGDTRRVKEPGC
ncbi:hypothetical protein QF038_003006 [Pseudarthrobacter sp. W1I19]|uniref:hypothetical protein n=1 Tax=Pseudarthrobacter sp. W1I19 TaxID=3042288 RepID=UPI00278B090D|nr:hypothetical protein [Pseudarthrobacter sp. W1I19]MDQ0924498.1 hypothetical protein [Pseudarthrobacter sp. W1I19]